MATFTAINRGMGTIQIHRAGCKDLKRDARGASVWDIEATTLQEIVEDVFEDMINEDPDQTWEAYAAELDFVNCTKGMLKDEAATPSAPQAKRTRRPQINHKECQHEATPKARKACRKAHWAAQEK